VFTAEITECRILSDAASATYAYYYAHIKPKPQATETKKSGWVCKICGYVYEGEELPADFVCPLCKHPASDFEKIS
jgi:rubrerythrin